MPFSKSRYFSIKNSFIIERKFQIFRTDILVYKSTEMATLFFIDFKEIFFDLNYFILIVRHINQLWNFLTIITTIHF